MSNNEFNPKSPTLQFTIWFTLISFVTLVAISYLMKVEVVVSGEGRIIPKERVQIVQSEFPGRIAGIDVQNGTAVHKGQPLVQLDTTDTQAELATVESELNRLAIENNRINIITSQISKGDPLSDAFETETLGQFMLNIDNPNKDYFQEQQKLLQSEIASLQSSLRQVDAQIESNKKSVDVTNANIERMDASIKFQQERTEISQSLLKQGASNKLANLDVEDILSGLEKQRDVYMRELDQKGSEKTYLLAQRKSIIDQALTERISRQSEIKARQETLKQQETVLERKLAASTIKAPVDGTIDQMQVYTIGGSVDAGKELMRVVPKDSELIVEALFSNENSGFMQVGQRANVSLSAYPSARFGYIKGEVTNISADSIEVDLPSGKTWGFVVQITPDEPYLLFDNQKIALTSGMTLKADVITEKRRIISYFFAPIIDTIQNSLGER